MTPLYAFASTCLFACHFALKANGHGILAFACALAAFAFIDLIAWALLVERNKISIALKIIFLSGLFLKAFPLLEALLTEIIDTSMFPWRDYVNSKPFAAALGFSTINLVTPLVVLFYSPFLNIDPRLTQLRFLIERSDKTFEYFLIVAALLKIIYWLAITDFSNPIFFLLRRLDASLSAAPLFLGFGWRRFPLALKVWACIFGLSLIISLLTGTRGSAFYPLIFFFSGYLASFDSLKARFAVLTYLFPVCATLAFLGVFIEAGRDVAGRTDLKSALEKGTLLDRISPNRVLEAIEGSGDVVHRFARRMTTWPPLVVPTMTPNPIQFRGFDDLSEEFRAITSFRIGGDKTSGRYYFSNIHLKPYGFAVHIGKDGFQTSSVEFSAFVDGFTRNGWGYGFLYCFIGLSILVLVERLVSLVMFPTNLSVYLITLTVIASPTRFTDSGLITSIRLLILETLLSAVVFVVVKRMILSLRRS